MATTIGVWIGDGETIDDRFDDQLGSAPAYSRSRRIKDAMELYLVVEDVLDGSGYTFDSERSKRHFVRQALLDATLEDGRG